MKPISFFLFVSSIFTIFTGIENGFWRLINENLFCLQVGLLTLSYQLSQSENFTEVFYNRKLFKLFSIMVLLDSLIRLFVDLTLHRESFSTIIYYLPNLLTFCILLFSSKINPRIHHLLIIYPLVNLYFIASSLYKYYLLIGNPKVVSGDIVVSTFTIFSIDTLQIVNFNFIRLFLIFYVIKFYKHKITFYGK